jgi:hypothetical protein
MLSVIDGTRETTRRGGDWMGRFNSFISASSKKNRFGFTQTCLIS